MRAVRGAPVVPEVPVVPGGAGGAGGVGRRGRHLRAEGQKIGRSDDRNEVTIGEATVVRYRWYAAVPAESEELVAPEVLAEQAALVGPAGISGTWNHEARCAIALARAPIPGVPSLPAPLHLLRSAAT